MSIISIKKIILILTLGLLFIPGGFVLSAETQSQLEQELQAIQQEIDKYTQELTKTQSQKNTLANKIKQLQTRQQAINLQIQETSLQLKKIDNQIVSTEISIKTNLLNQQALKNEMLSILRLMNSSYDNFVTQLFDSEGLSGVYTKVQEYGEFITALRSVLKQNKILVAELSAKQGELEEEKITTDNLLKISSIQKDNLNSSLNEQSLLMKETKGLESNYQAVLSDKKKRAAEIRSRIYELFNTGTQIDFGRAVDIAKWASDLTGVRPALLLAILTQESNLGKNVGTCNRAGDPPEKSWTVIMKPTRDQEPFKKIIEELGLNIDTTPVSCPMRRDGKQVGWGGAMGPAQFIPSTWMGYKDKVSALTGKPANPWDIRDAFLASAIKLKNDGANGTTDGEWKAALRYFAGSVNLTYRFYADNVMALAEKYQADIDEL